MQVNDSCFFPPDMSLFSPQNEGEPLYFLRTVVSCFAFCLIGCLFCSTTIQKKKATLKKMGFQDFDTLYQTNRPVAEAALKLYSLFKEHNLQLVYDKEKEELLAYDSIFSDLRDMQKDLEKRGFSSQEEPFPKFQIKDQTIYADLHDMGRGRLQLEVPSVDTWALQLQSHPKEIAWTPDVLSLSSGEGISESEFTRHPLFKNTLEKHNVFRFLTSFIEREEFQGLYDAFLKNIQREDWFVSYTSKPKELAYLSLFAFLDGKISEQDLFVIHMVASALQESSEKEPAEITVLQRDTAARYLQQAHYPPFDSTFYTSKKEEELEVIRKRVLLSLGEKSPLQRTAVAYPIFRKDDEDAAESRIIYGVKCVIGYRGDGETDMAGFVVMPPPSLCLELYQATSSLERPPPSDHTWMFGFNNDDTTLQTLLKGRPISVASPLFMLPYVHGMRSGKQLGITMHDMLYHVALDWQNPHVHLMICLGKAMLSLPERLETTRAMGERLLDREQCGYQKYSSQGPRKILQIFWEFMGVVAEENMESKRAQRLFFSVLENQLPTEFWNLEVISRLIGYYESKVGGIPSFEEQRFLRVIGILKGFIRDYQKKD